jgi:Holliday junction resolvasome RuvABC endonuclease subunit
LILGIDPSSKKIAACGLYDDESHNWWTVGIFANKFEPTSIREARRTMAEILSLHRLGKKRVAFVEEPVVGVGVRSTLVQALVSGGMQIALFDAGFTVHLVSNTRWKKALGLGGHASKDEIKARITTDHPQLAERCGGDQDLIDATGLALYGARTVRIGRRLVG